MSAPAYQLRYPQLPTFPMQSPPVCPLMSRLRADGELDRVACIGQPCALFEWAIEPSVPAGAERPPGYAIVPAGWERFDGLGRCLLPESWSVPQQ